MEQDGGLAPLTAGVDPYICTLRCGEQRGCTSKSPQRPTRQCGAGCCKAAPVASRQAQVLPRTLTPESPACASVHCMAQTGSGTGGQQIHRLCQRRRGGNRSGCRHEPVGESKTPLWARQPRRPVTVSSISSTTCFTDFREVALRNRST